MLSELVTKDVDVYKTLRQLLKVRATLLGLQGLVDYLSWVGERPVVSGSSR